MQRSAVSSILRSNQAYWQQLCESESLDHGIAFWSTAYRGYPNVNQFREVLITQIRDARIAFDQAEHYFNARGLVCRRWALSEAQDVSFIEPILQEHGFIRRTTVALQLARWEPLVPCAHVRILPARAMRAAYTQLLAEQVRPIDGIDASLFIRAALARLDEPSFSMFVAMVDGQPVGAGALYEVGDIGRLKDLFVLPAHRRSGIGRSIVAHLLALAQRLSLKMICAQVDADASDAVHLFGQTGFEVAGEIIEFDRVGFDA